MPFAAVTAVKLKDAPGGTFWLTSRRQSSCAAWCGAEHTPLVCYVWLEQIKML